MSRTLQWVLEDLIPHRSPMILIDSIKEVGSSEVEATLRIAEDCLFYESPNGVPSYVGIEYVAQTVAAMAGLRARRVGRDIELGYLLGTRRYETSLPYFTLGSELTIRVTPEYEAADLAKYAGKITDQTGRVLVDTAVTVYLNSPQGTKG